MIGYDAIEQGVITHLLSVFSDELTATTCIAADMDGLLHAIFETAATYGCLVDMGTPVGRDQRNEKFKGQLWTWQLVGIFLIRYNDEIESQARMIVNKLAILFQDDHRLGGLTPKAKINLIDSPEPTQVNDVPFYIIFFAMEVWDR